MTHTSTVLQHTTLITAKTFFQVTFQLKTVLNPCHWS